MKIAITIDTEEGWKWDDGFPVREYDIENILHLDRFHDLCQRYGLSTTYFTNHAVFADPKSAAVMASLATTGCTEIGMHLHPWITPPSASDDNSSHASFLENLPSKLATEKLAATYRLMREQGFQPTSFRGGRYSTGETTQRFLLEHGFVADASVCPFSTWEDPGAPDYRDTDERPQRISDPAVSDQQTGLWSIPLTRVFSRRPFTTWNRCFKFIENTPLTHARLIGIMEKAGIVQKIWLNFESEPLAPMQWLIRNATRLNLPYLCFTIHSSSLSTGLNPYSQKPEQVEKIFYNIEQTFKLLITLEKFEPATISEIAHFLESGK